MHVEDERHAARFAEAPVGEADVIGFDELCRRGLVGMIHFRTGMKHLRASMNHVVASLLPDQLTVLPPSTLRTWPVMNLASSEAMNTMPSATSSERPRRPIGTVVARAALFSDVPVKRVNMPVSTGPGATAFTRIPELTISRATDLVMPSMACLLPT